MVNGDGDGIILDMYGDRCYVNPFGDRSLVFWISDGIKPYLSLGPFEIDV